MHLRHSRFTYSPCAYGLFTKSKESIQKFNLMQDWGGGGGGGAKRPTPPRLELKVRSSHWSYSVKIGVLKHFANFTEKHLC